MFLVKESPLNLFLGFEKQIVMNIMSNWNRENNAVWMQHVSISSSRRKNRLLRSVGDLLLSEQWHAAEHNFCPIKQTVELCHKEERHW